mgnify:CR=1 FL=1
MDRSRRDVTRRMYVKAGAAAVSGGALAGCSRLVGDDGGRTPADSREPYAVEMAPMGTVEFEAVPETWMAYFSTYGDMGIALGHLDGLSGLVFTENWPVQLYETLPGVDVSFDGVEQLMGENGIDKEVFYELGCDVHLFDPNHLQRLADGLSASDFEEIDQQVGPVVGNSIRRRGQDWHDYRYYSLYEAFGTVADVFQERERYEAIESVHDTFIPDLQSRLPPTADRPEIGLLSINSDFENGSFYAYPIGDGNGKKQYRDLGIHDAFGPHIDGGYAQWDYEQILEIDPDVLVFSYGLSHASKSQFEDRIAEMRADPVGQRLSAVENDRLYRGGTSYQGPIINLLQTEIAAKQFYPDEFGEWRGVDALSNEDAQLFDHQRVGAAITGDL